MMPSWRSGLVPWNNLNSDSSPTPTALVRKKPFWVVGDCRGKGLCYLGMNVKWELSKAVLQPSLSRAAQISHPMAVSQAQKCRWVEVLLFPVVKNALS